jgi:23S rRNA pseudouridine955/2504/2580 synthase
VRVAADGKEARTQFTPLKRFGRSATLVGVKLETGRTHQIRVHAAHAGHAVIGDERYASAEINRHFASLGLERMFLHAATLSFVWPDTGEPFGLSTPLPRELAVLLASLERIES